jgi:hypothetical protein
MALVKKEIKWDLLFVRRAGSFFKNLVGAKNLFVKLASYFKDNEILTFALSN